MTETTEAEQPNQVIKTPLFTQYCYPIDGKPLELHVEFWQKAPDSILKYLGKKNTIETGEAIVISVDDDDKHRDIPIFRHLQARMFKIVTEAGANSPETSVNMEDVLTLMNRDLPEGSEIKKLTYINELIGHSTTNFNFSRILSQKYVSSYKKLYVTAAENFDIPYTAIFPKEKKKE